MKDIRLLVAALLAAVVFASVWLWRAGGDGPRFEGPLPAGQAATVDGVEYRLVSLLAGEQVPVGSGQVVAEDGAVLVLARLRYDATRHSGSLYCSFQLVAGDLHWRPEFGYYPAEPETASCVERDAGTVSALFEVPARLLAQVEGVAVMAPDGQPAPVLGGSPR